MSHLTTNKFPISWSNSKLSLSAITFHLPTMSWYLVMSLEDSQLSLRKPKARVGEKEVKDRNKDNLLRQHDATGLIYLILLQVI